MKIIIDIPENVYKEIINDTMTMSIDTQEYVIYAVQVGTVLLEKNENKE